MKQSHRRGRLRTAPLVLGAALGSCLMLLMLLGVILATRGEGLPALTEDAIAAAEARWAEHGPASYNVDVQIEGRQGGVVHLEVRNGQPTAFTRDGHTPSQRRTWDYWTVPSQLDTIRQDMDSAAAAEPFGAPPGTQVVLRAMFDEQYGYPRRYQRIVLGTQLDVEWTITRFDPVGE